MQIANITNTLFFASRMRTGSKVVSPTNKQSEVSSLQNGTKDALYENINGFLNKKYDKAVYLQNFIENMKNLNDLSDFDNIEHDYISTMMMTLDSVDDFEDISDGYLNWVIRNLCSRK